MEVQTCREKALNSLTEALSRELSLGNNDLIVEYPDVARAFPGGPHQAAFEYEAIDFKSLQQWASTNKWIIDVASETTPEALQHSPNIRFTKIL